MRRMHWWGAAAGVGALAVATVGVPAALAHPGPAKHKVTASKVTASKVAAKKVATRKVKPAPVPATRKPVTTKHGNGHGGHDGHGHWNPHCDYPPHGRPDVAITGQGKARRNTEVVITGTMKINGCGYENQKAGLYQRVRGHHGESWRPVGAPALTDKNGNVTFKITIVRTSAFRVFTAPADGLAPGASTPLTVAVKRHDERVNHH